MSDVAGLAARLIEAADQRTGIEALTTTAGPFDHATAYLVQDAVVAARAGRGGQVVGAKLGLTSTAKQRQMKVDQPLYGWLTGDMAIDVGQPLRCDRFIQPRCEPEVAFLLRDDLAGAHVTAAQVLAATAAVYPAIDVLDSRFAGYAFTLPDVIADNASGAGFVLGGQATDPGGIDLRLTGVVLRARPSGRVGGLAGPRARGPPSRPDRRAGGHVRRSDRGRRRGSWRRGGRPLRPARHHRAGLPVGAAGAARSLREILLSHARRPR